jgi:hypothetical protein
MAEETTPNPASEQPAPAEETAAEPTATPSTDTEPVADTAIDTTAEPAPKKPVTATKPPKAEGEAAPAAKPAAKKEKPPALEDKPFNDFIQQDYLPNLKAGLEKQGVNNPTLAFEKRKIQVAGLTQAPECWQVIGHWTAGTQPREFSIYFFDEDVKGKKGFSNTESGKIPSTLESFLIDERKVDLTLLVDRTLQRLNAQKWLVRN